MKLFAIIAFICFSLASRSYGSDVNCYVYLAKKAFSSSQSPTILTNYDPTTWMEWLDGIFEKGYFGEDLQMRYAPLINSLPNPLKVQMIERIKEKYPKLKKGYKYTKRFGLPFLDPKRAVDLILSHILNIPKKFEDIDENEALAQFEDVHSQVRSITQGTLPSDLVLAIVNLVKNELKEFNKTARLRSPTISIYGGFVFGSAKSGSDIDIRISHKELRKFIPQLQIKIDAFMRERGFEISPLLSEAPTGFNYEHSAQITPLIFDVTPNLIQLKIYDLYQTANRYNFTFLRGKPQKNVITVSRPDSESSETFEDIEGTSIAYRRLESNQKESIIINNHFDVGNDIFVSFNLKAGSTMITIGPGSFWSRWAFIGSRQRTTVSRAYSDLVIRIKNVSGEDLMALRALIEDRESQHRFATCASGMCSVMSQSASLDIADSQGVGYTLYDTAVRILKNGFVDRDGVVHKQEVYLSDDFGSLEEGLEQLKARENYHIRNWLLIRFPGLIGGLSTVALSAYSIVHWIW
ncbi:MAG: hypothetical protein KDD25_05845 [Bdellovibrionales bacterium]|nr:hypothetical protein [Bdellovibrionales bacterium]